MLGLPKNTRRIMIDIPLDDIVTVECEYIPEFSVDEILDLMGDYETQKLMKKEEYILVKKEEETNADSKT